MKSVDKFGHYRGTQGKPGPPGIGFHLTAYGNYDMQNKILANVKDPTTDQDAVTKGYMNRKFSLVPYYDMRKGGISARSHRIIDLTAPKDETDAVNLEYLKKHTLQLNSSGHFDAVSMRLTGLKAPHSSSDAVNKEYFTEKLKEEAKATIQFDKKEEAFNSQNHCVCNVGDAKRTSDAVNRKYLKSWLKIHGYLQQRELADAVINLRREINGLHKTRHRPETVQQHLNNIEDSFKRTWRVAVQEGGGQIKSEYSTAEKRQIVDNFKIESSHLDSYLEE